MLMKHLFLAGATLVAAQNETTTAAAAMGSANDTMAPSTAAAMGMASTTATAMGMGMASSTATAMGMGMSASTTGTAAAAGAPMAKHRMVSVSATVPTAVTTSCQASSQFANVVVIAVNKATSAAYGGITHYCAPGGNPPTPPTGQSICMMRAAAPVATGLAVSAWSTSKQLFWNAGCAARRLEESAEPRELTTSTVSIADQMQVVTTATDWTTLEVTAKNSASGFGTEVDAQITSLKTMSASQLLAQLPSGSAASGDDVAAGPSGTAMSTAVANATATTTAMAAMAPTAMSTTSGAATTVLSGAAVLVAALMF